jgi:hypothetical protein
MAGQARALLRVAARLLVDLGLEPRIDLEGVAGEDLLLVGRAQVGRAVDIALGVGETIAGFRISAQQRETWLVWRFRSLHHSHGTNFESGH